MPKIHRPGLSRRDLLQSALSTGAAAVLGDSMLTPAHAGPSLPLITKAIPATGERLPAVGLGTDHHFIKLAVFRRMIELGGKVLDTQPYSGDSEAAISTKIQELESHQKVFLATKTPEPGEVRTDSAVFMSRTFQRLRFHKPIDLMQIEYVHALGSVRRVLHTYLPEMQYLKKDRRLRYIGVCFPVAERTNLPQQEWIDAIRQHQFDFVRVNYSMAEPLAAERVLPLAAERGMAVLVTMPFGDRHAPYHMIPSRVHEPFQWKLLVRSRRLKLPAWASEIDVFTWTEFFLKYVISHPAVTCVIPDIPHDATTAAEQLEYLASYQRAARGRLPDAAMRRRMEQYWKSQTA